MKFKAWGRRVLAVFMALVTLGTLFGATAGAAGTPYPFTDDVENAAANNWSADLPWARTTADFHGGATSWTDSPGVYYGNNLDIKLTLASAIDLSAATKPQLKFWHHYQLEPGFDFAYVELSTDGGQSWPNRLASYSGTVIAPFVGTRAATKTRDAGTGTLAQEPWVMEQIDLTQYKGPNVMIQFRLVSDGELTRDGWGIDDIAIAELPTPVTLNPVANATRTSLDLSWTQNADQSFAGYRLYRSLAAGTGYNSTLVTSIPQANVTSFSNTGLNPKTVYYYKVYTLNTFGIYSASNEVSGATLAGLGYPFFDNMEAGGNNWVAAPSNVWTLVTPDIAHSGNKVWTDSPQGNYANNTDATLTLADNVEVNPASQLVFWHRLNIAAGDNALVEISTDNGLIWSALATMTGQNISTWTRVQLTLGNITGPAKIRFHLVTDAATVADGWYVDDVSISNIPAAVTLSAPVLQSPPTKALIQWTKFTDPFFKSYQLYRSISTPVETSSTLVSTITNVDTISFMDSGLAASTKYYYKVYVVNSYDAAGGSNETDVTTTIVGPGTVVSYPFYDDMENGPGSWSPSTPWGIIDTVGYNSTHSWTDSPVGNYAANANTSLQIAIDLRQAQMPVLSFWQQYSLETNGDFGYIDISTDGTNWSTIYFVTGASAWRQEKLDLTEYAVNDNVRIRFRLGANNAGTVADGWYIDNVRIGESETPTISYPFSDNMEDTAGTEATWLSSSWDLRSPGHSGTYYWSSNPTGVTQLGTWNALNLAGTLNLSTAVHPQLTYWTRYNWNYSSRGYVQVSTSKGIGSSYTTVREYGWYSGQGNWVLEQIDLTPYAGLSNVRIRFGVSANTYNDTWWHIDDVRIEESPTDTVLSTPTNVTRHGATLGWTQNTDTNFARYDIHRDTSTNVTLASPLVTSITDKATITYNDTYSILEPSYYYYKIYIYNDKGACSLGSNVVQAIYPVPTKKGYPFTDDMESGTANWDWGGTWGLSDTVFHGGAKAWADSPVGNYANNANSALELAIDLRTAQMPVLSFWQQYSLQTNADFGYVDVSTDGNSWSTIYFVTGNSVWRQEKIDLAEYAVLDNVRIRFRLQSDGDITADGWNIDDIKIDETTNASIAYPFFDDMENATTDANWLSSSWELGTPGHSGTYYWTSNYTGVTQPGTDNKLTLAGTFNLTTAVHPQLTYWTQYNWTYSTHGYVQISTSKGLGGSYTNLKDYGWYSGQGNWVLEQIDLTPYVGLSGVRIRFLIPDRSYNDSWWHIDDIRLEEAPTDVNMNPPANVTQHGVDVSWTKNNDANFVRYEVHRDTSSNVTLSSPMIVAITDQATTAYTNIIVEAASYYYRVFVFNDKGAHSLGSDIVQAIYSPPAQRSYPFFDDMENGTGNWDWTAPWGLTEGAAHSGRYSFTDSPVGNYANSANTSVGFAIDLKTAQMPVLSFWEQYTLGTNSDYGYVEVSTDGTNWSTVYFVTGNSVWRQEKIDLTEYAVLENVRIRFRLQSDSSGSADGWYIDDISIAEATTVTTSYPFFDDMESKAGTEATWLSSSWELGSPGHSGTYFWTSAPTGVTLPGTDDKLTLSGTLDLSTAIHPQLTYWTRYNWNYSTHGYVQISTSKGMGGSYTNLKDMGWYSGQASWVQEQIDLTPYVGLSGIRLRFLIPARTYSDSWWNVDDIRIAEAPTDITLNDPTNVTRHGADISWTKNMDTNFVRYELHRDTNSNPSLASPIVATITDQAITAFTDTYTILEPNYYYYRLYVFNDKGAHSLGSNAVQAVYLPPVKKSYPFFDDAESGTGDWDWSMPWSLIGTIGHSGTHSWTDSQTGNYADNTNTSLEFAIDLRTAQMPVLSFWEQYTLQTNADFGLVDISTDGTNWSTIYFVTGNSSWREQKIDISEYAVLDNVRIRFRLQSDGSGNADGWYIDDIRVAETTMPSIPYPLFDDMENVPDTEARWMPSSWQLGLLGHSGTYYWASNREGITLSGTDNKLTLAGTLNLSTAVHPKLTFWQRYNWDYSTHGYVQISTSKGLGGSYTNLKDYGWYNSSGNWVQEQIDLTPYVGLTEVRIRFLIPARTYSDSYWQIDDIRIDEVDNTAPAAVNDLTASNPTGNTIRLTWTAVGDDDRTGKAWQYDIRYSTSEITAGNFDAAGQCGGEPLPQLVGSGESFIVTGLTPATKYYFAVKTADEVPNWSAISNFTNATTEQAGVIIVKVDAPKEVLVDRDFSARIRLNNVVNFDACNYTLTFDPAVLSLVSVTAGDINGTVVPVGGTNQSSGSVVVTQTIPDAPGVSGSGYLSVVTFHVVGSAGTTSAITPSNAMLGDKDAQEIPSSWVADSVHTTAVLPGDANADESVNALDITKVERIVIGLDTTTAGADANLDSAVNALDITKVERIILGLD